MKPTLTTLAALTLLNGSALHADNLLTNGSFGDAPASIAEAKNNNPKGLLYNKFGYNRNSPIHGWIADEPGHPDFDVALVSGVKDRQSDGVFKDTASRTPITGYDADQRGAWVTASMGGQSSLTQLTPTRIVEGTEYQLSLNWAYVGKTQGTLSYQIIDESGKVLAEGMVEQPSQDLTLGTAPTLHYTGQSNHAGRQIGVKLLAQSGDNVFVIDAVSLTADTASADIPEPSIFGLFVGLAALSITAIRRRR